MEDRKALNITMFIVGAVICGIVTFALSFFLEMYARSTSCSHFHRDLR